MLGSRFSQAADGTGVAERLTESRLTQRATDVLADGTQVLFAEGNAVRAVILGQDRSIRA